ncbi:hypothetical protein RclHR1_00570052 [Rhizophagus clarus]|uniref:Alpha/beta hydrolase protein n=1 Tax=Rhizophagus clarus TaxID=94130 RepID=A0A2Z6RNX1_9GLOM|nr:hypothetical protein RclHR1_00570052 [Rhizophagus clarus]GET04182.1 alpha/beta hydrolase protein [Rhizophagus clarus]
MKVPIIGRLNFRDYQALVIGLLFLFLERSVRLVTYCLPNFVLEYLRSLSQKLYSMVHEDTRTDPAKIIQYSSTFREMVEYWGYTMEEHMVKTRDNYLLGIHRIPTGKCYDDDDDYGDKTTESHIKSVFNKCGIPLSTIRTNFSRSSYLTKERKPVVLLYHGLMMCSEIWMCNMEEERQLPFLLANAGYDVWLGNARGNKYSMKHTRFKPNESQFWEYSMDEFALFDLPDTIDYILETTGVPSLTYIGFSQGTAQSFAALSINPSLNKKVNLFLALAPATSPVGLQNPIVDAFIKASPNIVYLFFGRKAFLTMAMFWQKVLSPPIYTELLDKCMKFLFGWDGKNMTKEQKSVSYSHLYSFTSVKSLVHWFQIIRANKFQMYDELPPYSSSTAMGHYCQEFPTKQIKTPIGVFYGGSDSLVNIDILLKQLPKPAFIKEIQPYEHLDFLWASDVHKTVFPKLFDLLNKYNNVDHKIIDDEISDDYQQIIEKEFN